MKIFMYFVVILKQMKNLFFLYFLFSIGPVFSQEHVLLTLGLDSVFSKLPEAEPGGSIFIQRNGEILYARSFGLANIKEKKAFDENTVINIGPVTETFISYTILVLQQEGKLSIDDSLVKHFPTLKNKEQIKKIKLKHLLNHTSGLQNVQLTKNITVDKLAEKTGFEPGSNFSYSNANFSLLALIIEKTSGEKWADFIQKNILAPAGMINSKISDVNTSSTNGYVSNGKNFKIINNSGCNMSSVLFSNVYSSVNDLRKYINAIKECVFANCGATEKFSAFWEPANWRRQTPVPKSFTWYTQTINRSESVSFFQSNQTAFVTDMMQFKNSGITVICLSNNNTSYKEAIMKRLIALQYVK